MDALPQDYKSEDELRDLVKTHMSGWEDVPLGSISLKRMAGLSNCVYYVKTDQKVDIHHLILRVFEAGLIPKEKETLIFAKLSEHKLGPETYYSCEKYRLEEFYDARPSNILELRNATIFKQVLERLAKIHFNPDLAVTLEECDGGKQITSMDILINEWQPAVNRKYDEIMARLTNEKDRATMELVKSRWLGEDFAHQVNTIYPESEFGQAVIHNDA